MAKKFFLSKAKKKQLIVGAVIILVLIVGTVIAASYKDQMKKDNEEKKQETAVKKVTATDFTRIDKITDDSDAWQVNESAKISAQDRKIDELERKFNNVLKGKDTKLPQDDIFGNGTALPPPPPTTDLPKSGKTEMVQMAPKSSIQSVDIGIQSLQDQQNQLNTPSVRRSDDFKKTTSTVRFKGIRPNLEVYQDGGDVAVATNSAKFRVRESYIPAGTFFRVVLLGGVDAPTGGDAQNATPHPILMRVTDLAQLPNLFKYNFKECFITASAYGDISSERAYARTDRMSCVGADGRVLEVPIKGYVAGEDGKTGVRGRVVTKQGQIIANALLAGVISGAGKGVAESYKTTSTSVFGTTSSTKAGDEYKAGIADGMGNALDKIADYYIKLADKTFPVVEINAGRQLDVVLMQGFQIDDSPSKQ
ncbi:TraB/VirB10 family protein [Neisseria sp. Ec49-e6-T10]|uniref:TraB/VirB10 family protein n=1 Tax=Neisseria sp. Ec49-e6-T10 TaxID=3140744 RepID=UPI003EBEDD8D